MMDQKLFICKIAVPVDNTARNMDVKYLLLCAVFYIYYTFQTCVTETVTYINTEHPVVIWTDKKAFKNFTLISRRINRQDPRHYVEIYMHPLFTVDNSMKLDFYFYQLLTNRYRPSFIEMHFGFCDMVGSDSFFGIALKQALHNKPCPYPPGEYDLMNMTISYVPKGFPFTKGRIYCNLSLARGGMTKLIGTGYINMEVKTARINSKEKKKMKNINKV